MFQSYHFQSKKIKTFFISLKHILVSNFLLIDIDIPLEK